MDQFQLTVQKALWIHAHSLQSFEVHFSSYVFRHLKIMDTQMDKLKGHTVFFFFFLCLKFVIISVCNLSSHDSWFLPKLESPTMNH